MFLVSMSPSPQSPLKSISKENVNQLASKAKDSLEKKKKKKGFNRFLQEENKIRLLVRGQVEVIFVLLFVMRTS
jgi:hypothetical protein